MPIQKRGRAALRCPRAPGPVRVRSTTHLMKLLLFLIVAGSIFCGAGIRKVDVGGRKLFLKCTGNASEPTVVLVAGKGGTTEVWQAVQTHVATFASVCSYDRADLGQSDPTYQPQTAEIVEDLHQLLLRANIPPPYILVGHSMGGIYVRKFAMRYPAQIAGIVFVDSSDDEQVWRFAKISPELMKGEYPDWRDKKKLEDAGWLPAGEYLKWHLNVPLIALEHGIPWPRDLWKLSNGEYQKALATWHSMQLDLSRRSKYGQLRIATKSGHYIQTQQPELVVQAIRDVLKAAERSGPTRPRPH
jgi:pimeloyl-ACP methyl ester carboxylesterase